MLVSFVGMFDTSRDTANARLNEFKDLIPWYELPRITKDFLAHVEIKRDSFKGLTSIFTWAADYPKEDIELFRKFSVEFNTYAESCELRSGNGGDTRWILTVIEAHSTACVPVGGGPEGLREPFNDTNRKALSSAV